MSNHNMSQLNKSQLVKALILVGLVAGLTACGGGGSTSGAGSSDATPPALGDTPAAPAPSDSGTPAAPAPSDSGTPAAPAPSDSGTPEDPAPTDPPSPGGFAPGVEIPAPGIGPILPGVDLHLTNDFTANTVNRQHTTEHWSYHVSLLHNTVTITTPDGDTFTGTVNSDQSYTASGSSHYARRGVNCHGTVQVQGFLDRPVVGQFADQGTCTIAHFVPTRYNYIHNLSKD